MTDTSTPVVHTQSTVAASCHGGHLQAHCTCGTWQGPLRSRKQQRLVDKDAADHAKTHLTTTTETQG